MEKMRAVIFREHGDVDKLEYTDVRKPKPGPHEVLVKVKACALNRLDLWTLHGMPGIEIPLPHILGCDIAGEVAEIGPRVRGIPRKKQVVIAPGIVTTPSPYSITGLWDSLTENYQIIGFQRDGGYAEYVKVPKENVLPVSARLTHEEWAAVPLVFLTAWHALVTRSKLKRWETVLIHTAGSGIGSAAIQIAKHIGSKVITTVGSDAKIRPAEALGADHVIPYNTCDFAAEASKITKGRGVDVVVDHIGTATLSKSLSCLAQKGRLVTCGVTSGPTAEINLRFLFSRQLSIIGCYMGGRKELREVLGLVEKNKLRPVVDKVYPLREAKAALERMKSRIHFGKIVLSVDEAPSAFARNLGHG